MLCRSTSSTSSSWSQLIYNSKFSKVPSTRSNLATFSFKETRIHSFLSRTISKTRPSTTRNVVTADGSSLVAAPHGQLPARLGNPVRDGSHSQMINIPPTQRSGSFSSSKGSDLSSHVLNISPTRAASAAQSRLEMPSRSSQQAPDIVKHLKASPSVPANMSGPRLAANISVDTASAIAVTSPSILSTQTASGMTPLRTVNSLHRGLMQKQLLRGLGVQTTSSSLPSLSAFHAAGFSVDSALAQPDNKGFASPVSLEDVAVDITPGYQEMDTYASSGQQHTTEYCWQASAPGDMALDLPSQLKHPDSMPSGMASERMQSIRRTTAQAGILGPFSSPCLTLNASAVGLAAASGLTGPRSECTGSGARLRAQNPLQRQASVGAGMSALLSKVLCPSKFRLTSKPSQSSPQIMDSNEHEIQATGPGKPASLSQMPSNISWADAAGHISSSNSTSPSTLLDTGNAQKQLRSYSWGHLFGQQWKMLAARPDEPDVPNQCGAPVLVFR